MLKTFLSDLKTLFGRMAFFCVLVVLLPLAVLNRQIVNIAFNPMDILRAEPESGVSLPLFMALFAMFALGLVLGYGLAGGRKNPPVKAGKATLPTSGEAAPSMVKPAPNKQAALPADTTE